MGLRDRDLRLLNRYQRGFPLVPRPFRAIAEAEGTSENEVLQRFAVLANAGVVSRLGPIFRPHTVGASTLAAMAVPPSRLDDIATFVSGFPGVNHNYEREHRLNLWFVVTGRDPGDVAGVLDNIGLYTGLGVLDLPLEREYSIDLGFGVHAGDAPAAALAADPTAPAPPLTGAAADALVAAVQAGLPLLPRPYREVAARAGCREDEVLATLGAWLAEGVLRRFGVVVRHRELGYTANAMTVWDVADGAVDAAGEAAGALPWVTLCYRRPRRPPEWPYNLFCMIHGRTRATVHRQAQRLRELPGLARAPHALLFSRRRFKQHGAVYRPAGDVSPPGTEGAV